MSLPARQPKQRSGVWIEKRPMSRVRPAARNPKKHDTPGMVAAIRRWGFVLPLVEDEATGRLVAGHGGLEALQRILLEDGPARPPRFIDRDPKSGEWLIPILCGVAFANAADAEAYLIGDNRWVELGGWDRSALEPFLRGLLERGPDAGAAVGWPEKAIHRFLGETAALTRGATPTDLAPKYNAGALKSVNLYFDAAEYAKFVARVEKVMVRERVSNLTEALMRTLELWEKRQRKK